MGVAIKARSAEEAIRKPTHSYPEARPDATSAAAAVRAQVVRSGPYGDGLLNNPTAATANHEVVDFPTLRVRSPARPNLIVPSGERSTAMTEDQASAYIDLVGRLGIEPRTQGLKVLCSAS